MPHSEIDSVFQAMPDFAAFSQIVKENIGYFPRISFDPFSLAGHRVRIFQDPPSVEVRYSERALARYIELADIAFAAKNRNSPEALAAGLMVLRGGDALRLNRFGGMALVARGFMRIGFNKLPFREIIDGAVKLCGVAQGQRAFKLANLFLPLAHEIGHVPEAGAIAPKVLQTDAIFETYRINSARVQRFTGQFDYLTLMNDARSPLHLATLRGEAASDYFAVCSVCFLLARTSRVGEDFPLTELTAALLSFPLIMACQALCLAGPRSTREVQEVTLAMHCRYSLIIDSVRCALKGIFANHSRRAEVEQTIDTCVDGMGDEFDAFYEMAWKAIVQFSEELNKVCDLNNEEVIKVLAETNADVRRQLAMAKYLNVIAAEVEGYPVRGENLQALREFGPRLSTFDTVVIEEDKVTLIR